MIKNYFTIALRHLARHKLFSAINILCLGIGITFSMLIGDYVMQEKKVNSLIRNADNQYIIKSKWKVDNMGMPITTVAPFAKALKEEYPGLVNNYCRFNPVTNVVSAGDKHFKEDISICDTNLVSMYGFKLLQGNPQQAFKNNSSAIITENLAIKLFGTANAIDKTISITNTTGDKQDYSVSAVLAAMPYNTVKNILAGKDGYNVFVPFEGSRFFQDQSYIDAWTNIYIIGMIELKPGVSPAAMAGPMASLLAKRLPDNIKGLLQPELVALKDYYQTDNNGAVQKMITTLSLAAIFILLMAIINFVNISIGTSTYRLKEIGLRKVFGSAKKQLVIQYLVESLLLTFIAGLISLGLYEMVRPLFDQLLKAHLDPVWEFGWAKMGWLLLLVIVLGIIAGLYPAFVLSSSNIIHSVKGKIDTGKGGLVLRKTLLVVQFTLAIFIFISALNISKQVSYFFNKDLGYNKEQLLVITAFPKQWDSAGVRKMETIRDGLAQLPVVRGASISFEVPDRTPPNTTDLVPPGATGQKPIVVPTIVADGSYAATFGLQLKEGVFFNERAISTDQSEIVLNETAARSLGLKSAVGTLLTLPGNPFTFKVAGIVKDYNFSSFQQHIGPLAIIPTRLANSYRYLTVKINSANITKAISEVKEQWNKFSPGNPFEYTFMDDRFQSLYESELQLKKAAKVATYLNLLIVFMGIFGIIAFTLAKRMREIAVRKVLGADVKNIILLFIKDYALLIIIANVIAWPLAYLVTDHWLQNYVYRIKQDIVPYLTVAALISVATFVFISAQCFKAAVSNPVKNLRTE